jgi:hypothetical protein
MTPHGDKGVFADAKKYAPKLVFLILPAPAPSASAPSLSAPAPTDPSPAEVA